MVAVKMGSWAKRVAAKANALVPMGNNSRATRRQTENPLRALSNAVTKLSTAAPKRSRYLTSDQDLDIAFDPTLNLGTVSKLHKVDMRHVQDFVFLTFFDNLHGERFWV